MEEELSHWRDVQFQATSPAENIVRPGAVPSGLSDTDSEVGWKGVGCLSNALRALTCAARPGVDQDCAPWSKARGRAAHMSGWRPAVPTPVGSPIRIPALTRWRPHAKSAHAQGPGLMG
eukprot:scaffold837_cov416-Prasinococcus_capsulatus_cf.AAC.3